MTKLESNKFFKENHPNYFTTSDGIRIFYITNFKTNELDKTKPFLVFNYGLVCSFAHFEHQLPYFDSLGYNILIHDYRGHYNSSKLKDIESDCTFKKIVSDIEQLLTSLKVSKCSIIGHSLGVNITLECAKQFPDLIDKIILISGSIIPPEQVMMDSNIASYVAPILRWINDQFPKVLNPIWKSAFMNPLIQKGIHAGGFNTDKVPKEFVELYLKRIGQLEPTMFFKLFREMQNQGVLDNVNLIDTPTLIIGGDQDKVIPLYVQDILNTKLKNSELYVVKSGSHVCQADFPETVNQKIQSFLIS